MKLRILTCLVFLGAGLSAKAAVAEGPGPVSDNSVFDSADSDGAQLYDIRFQRGPGGAAPRGHVSVAPRGPVGGPHPNFRPVAPIHSPIHAPIRGPIRGPVGPVHGRPGVSWHGHNRWFVQPRWWAPAAVLGWIWMRGIPHGYWQCTAYDTQYRAYSAWGVDLDQAAAAADAKCEQLSGGDECYIPEGYCRAN